MNKLVKQESNKKYLIFVIVLLLGIGVYFFITNINLDKFEIKTGLSLENINTFFEGASYLSSLLLMVSVFAFFLSLIWVICIISKGKDTSKDTEEDEEEDEEDDE